MNPQQFVAILIEINAKLNPLIRIDDTLKRILVKEGLEEHDAPTPPVVTLVIKEFKTNHHRYVIPNSRLNLIPKSLHITQI